MIGDATRCVLIAHDCITAQAAQRIGIAGRAEPHPPMNCAYLEAELHGAAWVFIGADGAL